jgi:hypothetical protein
LSTEGLALLEGLNSHNPRFHQSHFDLDAQLVDEAMEPMWQQLDDLAAFEAPDSGTSKASLTKLNQPPSLDSEMMDTLNFHKTTLDDKLSHQLSTNGLINALVQCLILKTGRTCGWTRKSHCSFKKRIAPWTILPLLQLMRKMSYSNSQIDLKGQHTSQEILSLQLLKLLRAIGAPDYAYSSIMDIFSGSAAAQLVTIGSTFQQRDTASKHFANSFCLNKVFLTTLTKHMNG